MLPIEIQNAITQNFYESWKEITDPLGENTMDFSVPHFLTGIPIMMYNCIFEGDLSRKEIIDIIEYFKSRELPFMWFVTPNTPEIVPNTLIEYGIEEAETKIPGMVLDIESFSDLSENKSEISIKQADESLKEDFQKIFLDSFNNTSVYQQKVQRFAESYFSYNKAVHYIGYWQNNPAAIMSVFYNSGVAGVYDVTTLSQYRRRGIARSMMKRAIVDMKKKGYRYSVLHSTKMGHPLYLSLGYTDQFIYRRFLLRPIVRL